MDADAAALATAIGTRVRQARADRGWTLDQLAAAADTSRRSIINVEQGAANPSVGILLRLSEALGVGLPSLVAPPDPMRCTITRAGQGARLWRGRHGGAAELVAATSAPDVVELWRWTLHPGDEHSSAPHPDGTVELLTMLEGAATITVADQEFELYAGDSASLPGDVAHAYRNAAAATRPASFTMCVFEPRVGRTSTTVRKVHP